MIFKVLSGKAIGNAIVLPIKKVNKASIYNINFFLEDLHMERVVVKTLEGAHLTGNPKF